MEIYFCILIAERKRNPHLEAGRRSEVPVLRWQQPPCLGVAQQPVSRKSVLRRMLSTLRAGAVLLSCRAFFIKKSTRHVSWALCINLYKFKVDFFSPGLPWCYFFKNHKSSYLSQFVFLRWHSALRVAAWSSDSQLLPHKDLPVRISFPQDPQDSRW